MNIIDQIKVEIESRIKENEGLPHRQIRLDEDKQLLSFITTLQQEQSNKSFCEENCKGYRETGGKCFFGFNCSAKKEYEQPEVDLEK